MPTALQSGTMAFSPTASYAGPQYSPRPHVDGPIFQPPKASPAATVVDNTAAMAGEYFSRSSRKRQRSDSQSYDHHLQYNRRFNNRTPLGASTTPGWTQLPTPSDDIFGSASAAPDSAWRVNERYQLAGGYDTPSLLASTYDQPQQQRIFSHGLPVARRRLRDESTDDYEDSTAYRETQLLAGPLARERNGVARMTRYSSGDGTTDSPSSTWTGLAFSLVGKVFNFGTSVVKGFYAGGGQGYDLNTEYSLVGSDLLNEGTHTGGASARRPANINTSFTPTPLPGAWDDNEFLGDFEQDNPTFTPSPTTRPPTKRRQTDRDTWVVVGNNGSAAPSPVPTAASLARPDHHHPNTPRAAASRAQSRRSLAGAGGGGAAAMMHRRTGTADSPYTGGSPLPGAHGGGFNFSASTPSHARRASVASMRSAHSRHSSGGGGGNGSPALSYVSPEAERFARRQARQDRAADKAMNSMSRKMEEMIRQAQAALGTKVSVEGGGGGGLGGFGLAEEDEDEGFVDDDEEEEQQQQQGGGGMVESVAPLRSYGGGAHLGYQARQRGWR